MGLGRIQYLSNVKILKQFKEDCFKIFKRERTVNMKSVMEHLRNSQKTLSTQKLIISRNFQDWPKFLVPYKNMCKLPMRIFFVFSKIGKYFHICDRLENIFCVLEKLENFDWPYHIYALSKSTYKYNVYNFFIITSEGTIMKIRST